MGRLRFQLPPRSPLLRLLVVAFCLLVSSPARADESDLLLNPIGSRHVDRIIEILGADQAQADAIRTLHAGYRRNVLDLRKAHREAEKARRQAAGANDREWDDAFEAADDRARYAAIYRVVDSTDALTRAFFADLASLAGDAAATRVEAAERFHRRRAGGRLPVCGPERADLIELARETGVTRSPEFDAALVDYELRFDEFMKRKLRRVRTLFEELAQAEIDSSTPAVEALGEVLGKLTAGSIEIRDFNIRQARILRDLLPEAEQAAWTRAFNARSYPHVHGRDLTADAYAQVRSVEGLDADQLEAIDRIHERYRNEVVGADARYVVALNRRHDALANVNVVAFMDEIDKRPELDDLSRAEEDRNLLAQACVKRMMAVLTREQRVSLKDPVHPERAYVHDDLLPLDDEDESRKEWRETE